MVSLPGGGLQTTPKKLFVEVTPRMSTAVRSRYHVVLDSNPFCKYVICVWSSHGTSSCLSRTATKLRIVVLIVVVLVADFHVVVVDPIAFDLAYSSELKITARDSIEIFTRCQSYARERSC